MVSWTNPRFFYFAERAAHKLVELKNGETYNGHLVNCDGWMNINLRDVICTSRVIFLIPFFHLRGKKRSSGCLQDGERFWKIPHCYIRGNTIKYLCIPDEAMPTISA